MTAKEQNDDVHGHESAASTPTKQSKITRFLPARKAREQASKQITIHGGSTNSMKLVGRKRGRISGGLVGIGSPDLKPTDCTLSPPEKKTLQSPVAKKLRPLSQPSTEAVMQLPSGSAINKIIEINTDDLTDDRADVIGSGPANPASGLGISSSDARAVPAYQRYANLLYSPEDDSSIDRLSRPHLPLPSKYILLARLQQALDSAICIASGRGQRAVWHRVVPSLQSTLNRTLSLHHLHLLCSFVPGFYHLEPCKIIDKGRRIDSVFIEHNQDSGRERERRDMLMRALLEHVQKQHGAFLEGELKIVLPDGAELRMWHPKFDLEGIADPPVSPTAAKSAIHKGPIPEMIKNAIDAECKADAEDTSTPDSDSKKPDEREQAKKKMTLVERIRLKEQNAELEKMLGASSNRLFLRCLPDLVDTLSFLFSSSKKAVLFLSVVQERLRQSTSRPLSNQEIDERLDALQRHLPDWIVVNRKEAPFTVRVDRTKPPKGLKDRLALLL